MMKETMIMKGDMKGIMQETGQGIMTGIMTGTMKAIGTPRKIWRAGTAVLAFALASCGVYQPYTRPNVDTDGLYRDAEASSDTTASLAGWSWRELFTDVRLQALIERGLQCNTDLRIARLQTEEMEAALMNACLSYLPSLSLSPEAGVSHSGGETVRTYNLAASASWELDIFGKNTNVRRGAKAALEGSRDYAQAVQTQLVATIAGSYYTLLMLDRQLEVGEQTMKSWENSIRTLEALKRAGEANDAAVLQARANRMQLESSVLSIRKSIRETENALSALLALSSQPVERGRLSEAAFPGQLAVGVPLQLLSNRPDVRQAERNYAQACFSTNTARAAFYPSLTLSGALGWTNNGGGVVANPGKWLMNAIGSVTQPLFNKGANLANLKVARARQEEALLRFQQSLLDAGKEVNNALEQWQSARQRINLATRQVETLRELVRKTELLMRHTSTTYLEVLTAQQSLLSAEQTQAQDRFDEIQGVINLYHALGGGIR